MLLAGAFAAGCGDDDYNGDASSVPNQDLSATVDSGAQDFSQTTD
jgi:hypothetical protein